MKNVLVAFILMFALILLCACDGNISSYSATLLITTSNGDSASMQFHTFRGTRSFKLKTSDVGDRAIDFKASLAEGEMNVYISVDGEKELLVTVKGGESYNEAIALDEKYNNEKTISIILESEDKSVDGSFKFEYN